MRRSGLIGFGVRFILIVIVFAAGGAALAQQSPPSEEQIWKEFLTWFRAAPLDPGILSAYIGELGRKGLPREEVERRFSVVMRYFSMRTEGIEAFYDKTYGRPLTGNPEQDGFNSEPSVFLVAAIKNMKPGRALDVGMGQGRNAVELARMGWDVTGFDISGEAVASAVKNAESAGVTISAVKADYASFDFGKDAWDLVAMIFAWAPVTEPSFVARIKASLRPGGIVIFEHFVEDPARPYPPMVRALRPGLLRDCFAGFEIVRYDEFSGTGDWGGPGAQLVRMVARKR